MEQNHNLNQNLGSLREGVTGILRSGGVTAVWVKKMLAFPSLISVILHEKNPDRKTISRDASKFKKMDRPKYLASASKSAVASLPK